MTTPHSATPKEFYTKQLAIVTQELSTVKKRLVVSSMLRLAVFIGLVLGVYFSYDRTYILVPLLISGIVLFLFLLSRHGRLVAKKQKLEALHHRNQLELKVLQRDWSDLSPGDEYIDPSHPYSHDIDLFGHKSFFQYLNRTATKAGKDYLAQILTSNSTLAIPDTQEAIRELAALPTWRQNYYATASLASVTTTVPVILQWLKAYQPFVPSVMRYLPTIVSIISIIVLALWAVPIISFSIVLVWFFVGLVITGTKLKKINALYQHATQIKDTFDQYYQLVQHIENYNFTSTKLQKQKNIVTGEGKKVSEHLKDFSKILHAFDQRNNMLFGFGANGFLLWDLKQCYKIEQWVETHKDSVEKWFEVLAFFDSYNSLGNFAFNHPQYTFPEITHSGTILNAHQLGHPLLDPEKRVDNDILIDHKEFFIITGANMAGKSTFLRTVALQIVLANVGLPVCAESCTYRPIKLYTSMRTSDSLSDDASYFFSELTQLKQIVEAFEQDEYFIILDEILKGTNSKDKAAGSRKFVERLVKANATGIIATHDLSLCEIATELPQVKNRYFDAEIINDELFFDYTFKDGVCQNMNASFLLKKMGIV